MLSLVYLRWVMIFKVGIVTIGQSPRVDVVPEIKKSIPEGIEIIERGALDDLSLEEIKKARPDKGDELLVTRMRDGTEVTIGRSFILPRLQEKISELEAEGVELVALLCAGEFPGIRSERPLLLPDRLLSGVLSSLVIKGQLGVMVPSSRQVDLIPKRFQELGFEVVGVGASPYTGNTGAIVEAAEKLKEAKVDLTVMTCFGYNTRMKREVKQITGKPVILIRSLLAKVLAELVD